MAGAPSKYTPELFESICDDISSSSISLRDVAKKHGIETKTIFNWLEKYPELVQQYARAKEKQADFMVDEMIQIADDIAKDTITKIGKGGEKYDVENTEWVNRSKLRIETRKWLAGKLRPKKWGDKVDVDLTSNGEQIKININLPNQNGN